MGILKILKGRSKIQEGEDHFDFPPTLNKKNQHYAKSYYPHFWYYVGLFAIGLTCFGVGGYLLTQNQSKDIPKPFVYFEIRAIDQSGHPIAGATVIYKKKKMGTTDSFGEWRRYIRIPLGSTIKLHIRKRTQEGLLAATKNLAIPAQAPSSKEIEMGGPIKLRLHHPAKAQKQKKIPVNKKTRGRTQQDHQSINETFSPAKQNIDKIAKTKPSIWLRIAKSNQPEQNRLIQQHVLPAIKDHLPRLNLELSRNSQFQVLLQHLSSQKNKFFPGLVRVIAKNIKTGRKFEFLQNYTGKAQTTAHKILSKLLSEKTRSELKEPYPQNWQKYHLQIFGIREKSSTIFVGGVKGRYLGQKLWGYWGPPQKTAYLSVINKGQIIHRQLIHNRKDPIHIISVPAMASISRK